MEPTQYPKIIRDAIDEMMLNLVRTFLEAGMPFRLILTPEDTWNKALPDSVLEQSQDMMVLDIDGQSLEDSFYNEESVDIYIVTGFEREAYVRLIDAYDIMGVIDIHTQTPLMIKPYDSTRPDIDDEFLDEMIEMSDAMSQSYSKMKAMNPELFTDK